MPLLTNQRSRFLGGGRLAAPVPALGAELLTNGDFETWSSATNAGTWVEEIGGGTVNRDNAAQYAGTYCARMDRDASGTQVDVYQTATGLNGNWFQLSAYVKSSVTGAIANLSGGGTALDKTVTDTYAQYVVVGRASSNIVALVAKTANRSTFFDAASVKPITLASMFSTRPYSTHVTVKAQATVVAGTRAGVVCNLDSATNPQNFVIASHDSVTARLTKCVGGTYTELLAVTTTYAAGAYVEIRRILGTNDFELWYNGAQVGAAQTITDAGIISNTLAGMFNTYSGNTLAAFSCVPSTVPSYSWATAGGAPTPVAAYMPKGSTSLAASYSNLVAPGTNNAAPGTAPTFAAATGWTFNGSDQYLVLGTLAPTNDQTWTYLVRFSGATAGTTRTVLCAGASTGRWGLRPSQGGTHRYLAGNNVSVAGDLAAGVMAVAGNQGYLDGTAQGGTIAAIAETPGAFNVGNRAGATEWYAGNVLAIAIYSATLTPSQVAAVSAAMAAL